MVDALLDPTRLDEEKRAASDHDLLDVIARRWSPRAFQDRDVESEKLLRCLEAARWAPSCFNEQPWRFIVATRDGKEAFAKMLACFTDSNQRWAKGAPILMVSFAKKTFTKNGKPARTAEHDVGLAVAQLVLQATQEGLVVHQAAGIHLDQVREVYAVPEDYVPVAGIAIGYRGMAKDLPEDLYTRELRPRTRKALPEFVFAGEWDHPADLVR